MEGDQPMTTRVEHPPATKGEAKGAPFGFLALEDRRPDAVPAVRLEIRDLLAQRGKG